LGVILFLDFKLRLLEQFVRKLSSHIDSFCYSVVSENFVMDHFSYVSSEQKLLVNSCALLSSSWSAAATVNNKPIYGLFHIHEYWFSILFLVDLIFFCVMKFIFIQTWEFLIFKLSPCFKCNIFSFGCLPGVWVLIVDVSELYLFHIFDDWTDRVFWNVGY
jgi:hypothetical protein